jgi:hypothetical protein
METYENDLGTWSKEMKNGRLVEKLIKPKKAASKKKSAKKTSKKE